MTRASTILLVAATVAVAAALRLWTLAEQEAANPLFRTAILDEAVYLREAARMRDGLPPTQPSLVSLLWPWVLAAVGTVTRHGAALMNVVLGTATAGVAAWAGARFSRSLVAGAVAGGLCATSGALVLQDGTAQIEPLLGLLVLAACVALVAAARRPSTGRLVLAGAAVGVAFVGRGTNAALALGWLPLVWRAAPHQQRWLRAATLLAAAAAPVLAFQVVGGAVPTSAGINLWLGNNPWSWTTRSFGTGEFPLDPDLEAREVRAVAEGAEGRTLSVGEVNAWWAERTLGVVRAAPGRALAHVGVKAALVFSPDDTGGIHDAVAEREFAPWTRVAPVSFAWVFALGAAGWIAARRTVGGIDAAGLAAAGFCAALVVFFPLTRYRIPILPVAALLVGCGVVEVLRGAVSRRTLLASASLALGLGGVAVLAAALRPPQRAESWTNLGIGAIETGVGDADAFLRRAADADPAFPTPRNLLGSRALGRGDAEAALAWFTTSAIAASRHPRWRVHERDAALGRANALSHLRRHAEAVRAVVDAAARFPQDALLAADGVHIALAANDRAAARRLLAAARALAPSDPRVIDAARALGE